MLMSLLSHILSAWFAFLLPSYATFKALSHRPLSEPDLQRWAMYWSVIGAFVAFEHAAEWLISWLPFYWEVKTLFLLYLAFPQTQGSTYIYTTYLQPFFIQNEADLDEGIVQVQKNILTFAQTRLVALWEFILNAANKRQGATSTAAGSSNTSASTNNIGLQNILGLWQMYGTSVLHSLVPSSFVQSVSGTPTQRRSAQNSNDSNVNSTPASPANTPLEGAQTPFSESYHSS